MVKKVTGISLVSSRLYSNYNLCLGYDPLEPTVDLLQNKVSHHKDLAHTLLELHPNICFS